MPWYIMNTERDMRYTGMYSADIRVLKLHVEFLLAKGTKQYM